jgi:hypothetical protein
MYSANVACEISVSVFYHPIVKSNKICSNVVPDACKGIRIMEFVKHKFKMLRGTTLDGTKLGNVNK